MTSVNTGEWNLLQRTDATSDLIKADGAFFCSESAGYSLSLSPTPSSLFCYDSFFHPDPLGMPWKQGSDQYKTAHLMFLFSSMFPVWCQAAGFRYRSNQMRVTCILKQEAKKIPFCHTEWQDRLVQMLMEAVPSMIKILISQNFPRKRWRFEAPGNSPK